MTDTEHHWVYVEAREPFDGLIQACPLIVADNGSVEGIMDGLVLITDLDGLKERAWTITKADNIYEPTDLTLVWAAEGHGTRTDFTTNPASALEIVREYRDEDIPDARDLLRRWRDAALSDDASVLVDLVDETTAVLRDDADWNYGDPIPLANPE